jgi:hypothetical protein
LEILAEDFEQQAKIIQKVNRPPAYNNDDANDNRYGKCSSSASSSLPEVRQDLMEYLDLNINDFVKTWLNDSE